MTKKTWNILQKACIFIAFIATFASTTLFVEGAQMEKEWKEQWLPHEMADATCDLDSRIKMEAETEGDEIFEEMLKQYEDLHGEGGYICVDGATEEDYREFFMYFVNTLCGYNQSEVFEYDVTAQEYWDDIFYKGDKGLAITDQAAGFKKSSDIAKIETSKELSRIQYSEEDTDEEIARRIIYHMCETASYNIDNRYARTFYEDRETCCSGYADAFYDMCKSLGIPCRIVAGDAGGLHAWNQVYVNDKWVYVDITWADTNTVSEDGDEYIDNTYVFSETLWEDHKNPEIVTEC